jgi:hypothetical protein
MDGQGPKKTDGIIKDQYGRAVYGKFSIITLAKSLFSSKKNQDDMQDFAGPRGERG